MAILRHDSIKNGNYGKAQRYLLFEHYPETQKRIRDEQGNMVLWKGYIQSLINCNAPENLSILRIGVEQGAAGVQVILLTHDKRKSSPFMHLICSLAY